MKQHPTNTVAGETPRSPRASRRALIASGVAAGLGLSMLAGWTRGQAQERAASLLGFSNWAVVEPSTRDSMTEILHAFEQIYGARIDAIGIPFPETIDQLQSLARMGALPDVMQLSGNWPRALASDDLLADLEALGIGNEAPELLQSYPAALEAGTFGGVLHAVPFTVAPLGFWHSKEALRLAGLEGEPPPRTIAELDRHLEQLRASMPADAYPIRIDVTVTEYALTRFWPWIWTFGGNPMVDDGQGGVALNWTDAGTTGAFAWLQRLSQNGYLLPPEISWRDRQLMATGKLAYMLDGPYMTSQITTLNPRFSTRALINEEFGVTTTPVLAEGNAPVTVADFHQLAVSARTQNPELALKLIRYLTTSDQAIRTFLIPQGGLLPVPDHNTGTEHGESYADAIGMAFIDEIVPSMRLPPYGPGYTEAARRVAQAMRAVAEGGDVADTLAALQVDVQAEYDKAAKALARR